MSDSSSLPVKIGILGSTRGTDMQALIDAIEAKTLNADIVCVLSDRRKAYILKRAEQYSIPSHYVSPFEGPREARTRRNRIDFDREMTSILKNYQVDIVLLIGFMRILSKEFCLEWSNRALNVHPSLLPEFGGGMDSDVHQAVLNAGRKESGCTVHLVTEELDGGPIVVQKRCNVLDTDTPQTLKQRVQELEGKAFIEAVQMYGRDGSFTDTETHIV